MTYSSLDKESIQDFIKIMTKNYQLQMNEIENFLDHVQEVCLLFECEKFKKGVKVALDEEVSSQKKSRFDKELDSLLNLAALEVEKVLYSLDFSSLGGWTIWFKPLLDSIPEYYMKFDEICSFLEEQSGEASGIFVEQLRIHTQSAIQRYLTDSKLKDIAKSM